MKIILFLIAGTILLNACSDAGKSTVKHAAKDTAAVQKFFPVTAFLQGEIYTIKANGVNPLKYTTMHNHTDSVWLKIEELDAGVREFLNPVIDSASLNKLFVEKSFLDQTLNAITLTYEPIGDLPDSMQLKHWDVYIEPKTGKVKRIYMVKEIDKNKTLQLTWVSNQWCKITAIKTDEKGNTEIEKEEKLIFDF